MAVFENQYYQLRIKEGGDSFEITASQSSLPRLTGNCLQIIGKLNNGWKFSAPLDFQNCIKLNDEKHEQVVTYAGRHDQSGIDWRISFVLADDQPLVFWRVQLTNQSSSPLFIEKIIMLGSLQSDTGNVLFPESNTQNDLAFYSNGWQSWSYTGAYRAGDRMRRTNLGLLQEPMVYNSGTPKFRAAGRFSSDFFGVLGDRKSRSGLLLGFLSQKNHFGCITADIRRTPQVCMWAIGDNARLDPQSTIATDWAAMSVFNIDEHDPLAPYLDAVAGENAVSNLPATPAGWCSWYYYYEDITPEIIRNNLLAIKDHRDTLPLDLVQVDDGFEAQVGDWLEFKPEFSQGVKTLADEIKEADFTPGLWLAPFILHPNSRLAVEHPDWLLRKENGNLVRTGFVWNSLGAALDLTVPGALEYVCKVVDVAAHQWGYPYLKLDFLYAAALKGVYHDAGRTRAQVLRSGMEAIRRTVGEETTLLGCGAPLGSMLGLVQAMRIGADVSGYWKPTYFGTGLPFKNEPHMPSARNSIQNILSRAALHGRWWVNDPDCLLVRADSDLSLEEIQSLATVIGMTGGSVLLSDNMASLSEERIQIAAALLPQMQERVQVLDWLDNQTPEKLRIDIRGAIGDWHSLAYFNWQDKSASVNLHAGDFRLADRNYWVRSFWDNGIKFVKKGGNIFEGEMSPHSVRLLALRAAEPEKPLYLGSSLHISQGLEIKEWVAGRKSVSCQLAPAREANAVMDFCLPNKPVKALYEGMDIEWTSLAHDCYRFNLQVQKSGRVQIKF